MTQAQAAMVVTNAEAPVSTPSVAFGLTHGQRLQKMQWSLQLAPKQKQHERLQVFLAAPFVYPCFSV